MSKSTEADLSLNELKENKIDTGILFIKCPLPSYRLYWDTETRFSYES